MTSIKTWPQPSEHPPLLEDEVHVWLARLNQLEDKTQALFATLTQEELDRAARFHFMKDRLRFIRTRGILRALLARYLKLEAQSLRFDYNAYGKPSLAGLDEQASALRFNLSHAHELALYAFTRGREIGIDVEHVRQDFAGEEIAERFFSAHEVAALRALSPSERVQGFFNCWTRKEAYIKARGEGLSLPLDKFDVSLATGDEVALLAVRDEPQELRRWRLRELMLEDGYAAALAVEGEGWQLRCWEWAG